ncbi:hypothetical protein AHMF7605_12310 [Adhaeribacter arboris]|uniref:Uncharacterized protein n=1 Tax=Adhaeribacter arboris TaxID=2072846 RepID=A0A2T2YFG1_9BACT|nr:hypothetical protein [Adhaeribacter arboris]PSR54251.1 hypothetical protein AHMF7605_12310 [Adhaeribacter arboris]
MSKNKALLFPFCLLMLSCNKTETKSQSLIKMDAKSVTALNCGDWDKKVYQYKGEPRDPDSLAFTIVFKCTNGKVGANMFGPYPAEEHGLFYFSESLDSLMVEQNTISFSFVEKTYYQKPFNLNNFNRIEGNPKLGGSNYRQMFKGKIVGDSIIFECRTKPSYAYECYDDTMVFVKK